MVRLRGSRYSIPVERYGEAMEISKFVKEKSLAAAESEERAEIIEHWVFDDIDEEEYM